MTTADALTLVLIGPMGAGKTSIGRRVARHLGVGFVDTDRRVSEAHGPIPEIFAREGEARFRELEREAVATALAEGGVISLGGGAVTSPTTRMLLAEPTVVYLAVSAEAVGERLRDSGRPLLDHDDPLQRWREIYQERRQWYEQLATVTFDTSRRPMQRIAAEIADWKRAQT